MSIRGANPSIPTRGTVSLVALCFVAVLGISLAGYIAVCSRAMTLSNRSFQADLSQQLAELGLEEALRAFNKNDWSDWSGGGVSVDWDTTTYSASKRAVANLTFSSGKFGQGTTATVKLRVDNYDAAHLGATWSSSTTYRINDLVGYSGTWYRSLQNANSNHTPGDLAWWVPMPIPWTWSSSTAYAAYDIVNYNGTWYRCHTSHTSSTSNQPPSTSYWASVSSLSLSWSSSTSYARGAIVFASGAWYYSIDSSNTNHAPPNATYWAPLPAPASDTWQNSVLYAVGDYTYEDDVWYRCILSHTSSGSNRPPNSTYWSTDSLPYISWAWRSDATYKFNDVVFHGTTGSGTWYRCKVASTTSVPTTSTDWENALSGTNTTFNPGPHGWSSSSINYNLWDTVYYSGQWYRCIKAHTSSGSITPASTVYWTNTPAFSTAWDYGRQYGSTTADLVRYNGVWYRCLVSNNGSIPSSSTTNWASAANSSYAWNRATAYTAGNYVAYGGVWYKCLTSHSNKSPNDTTYWTATWANSFSISTGAPVAYAEAAVSITNNPPVKTQLRASLAPAPLFPNAAAATTTISANSAGTVDSYDSTTGTYTSQLNTSTNYSAIVAAGNTAGTAITLSSTTVKGYLAAPSSSTTPYAPLVSVGTSASVKGSTSPASPSVDLTRVSRSPFIPQFTTLPSGGLSASWSTTPKGTALVPATTVNIGTPGAIMPSRYYYNGNLTIGTASFTTLKIHGPVKLYINGDLLIDAAGTTGRIDINSAGSAEIHVADAFQATISGEGILNHTTNPKSLIIISDTTSTSSHYYSEGVNPLYGVVYIPYSTSNTGFYNNNNSAHIYGAVSATKITYSGANLNLHYDTSLRYATFGGVDQPHAVTEWRELPASEQATMP